jgi:hypothetical protein
MHNPIMSLTLAIAFTLTTAVVGEEMTKVCRLSPPFTFSLLVGCTDSVIVQRNHNTRLQKTCVDL